MRVVTRYSLAVLLRDCATLTVCCKQSSVVQQTFALLVAGCSQRTQTVVWDDHDHCYQRRMSSDEGKCCNLYETINTSAEASRPIFSN